MTEKYIETGALGIQHFCIKSPDPIESLKQKYHILNLSDIQITNTIDWKFIYTGGEESKNFVLLIDLNGWSYFIWNLWDFSFNIDFAEELSEAAQTTVNYYFVDSHIATAQWIFTNKGILTRAYFESHGRNIHNFGTNEIENYLRETIKATFVESIFWDLYEKTCLSIESINNQKINNFKLYSGTIGEKINQS